MNLFIAQPELSGVIWRQMSKSFLVLNPIFLEVLTPIQSLEKKYKTKNLSLKDIYLMYVIKNSADAISLLIVIISTYPL